MIRRFNYTGRKKILRNRIKISLNEAAQNELSFDMAVQLDGLAVPGNAEIFVEAYRRDYFRRFSCGTVEKPAFPKGCLLEGVAPRSLIMFRVKIVDRKGRIVASADRIIPHSPEDEESDKLCLLPVDFVDLGNSVWRVELSDGWPSLLLNKRIENIREIARSDTSFLTLVYPEVVRQVLNKIVVDEDHTDPETDPDDWMSRWLQFVMEISGKSQLPPSGESEPVHQEKQRWIDDAVDSFAASHRIMEKFIQGRETGES